MDASDSSTPTTSTASTALASSLASLGESIPELISISVVTLPDCLAYLHWGTTDDPETREDRAVHAGDLVQTLRRKLVGMGALEPGVQIMIQSSEGTQIVREIGGAFAMLCTFRDDLPLGMAQIYVRHIAAQLATWAWKRSEPFTGTR
jgi:hypothetical protein